MLSKCKAFTLVEMLVALAVSSIIIIASYASYDLVATQYRKNLDIADMHTSGRAIMRIIERDIRMAGFEYRDKDAKVTYGTIRQPPDEKSKLSVPVPLGIEDSFNKCCDKVRVIYDYFDEDTKKAERIRIRYWAEPHTSNKGSRYRLYKQKDILGQNKKILAKPKLGTKDVMADYIEDFQLVNVEFDGYTYVNAPHGGPGSVATILVFNPKIGKKVDTIPVKGLVREISGLAFDPKGWIYAGSYFGGGIYKINASTKEQIRINSSIDKVGALAYNKETKNLYVGGIGRGDIIIINPISGNTVDSIKMPIRTRGGAYVPGATALAFDNNNRLFIGHGSHYNLVIVDPVTKKPVGDVQNYSLPQGEHALAGDSKGIMYAGGSGVGGLTPFKSGSRNIITSPKEKKDSMMNGVTTRGIIAATIGSISTGQESLVTINLTLRTKNQYGKDRQFKKKDYHAGNYKLDKTDKYKRDTFSSTVLVRNLAL